MSSVVRSFVVTAGTLVVESFRNIIITELFADIPITIKESELEYD